MVLEAILPEIYTFIDFATHECQMARKKGIDKVTTHIGGEIPEIHPMPYNVYFPVSEYLKKNPADIDTLIEFLGEEFKKEKYDYKKITFLKSTYTYKKGAFGKKQELPFVNVTIEL